MKKACNPFDKLGYTL